MEEDNGVRLPDGWATVDLSTPRGIHQLMAAVLNGQTVEHVLMILGAICEETLVQLTAKDQADWLNKLSSRLWGDHVGVV